MPGKPWKIDLIWLPKDEELDKLRKVHAGLSGLEKKQYLQLNSVLSLRRYLSKHLGTSLSFKEVKPQAENKVAHAQSGNSEDGLFGDEKRNLQNFTESTYCIGCEFELETSQQNFISLYCSLQSGKDVPETWLSCDFDFILQRQVNLEDVRAHSSIDLKSFSLGNFVGLNMFVQHFSSTSEATAYKVTPVKVDFKHLSEKLLLYFVVSSPHASRKRQGSSFRHFIKAELPYSSVNRVLLCHESKQNFVGYFHLLVCPLLYEAKWRVGDAKEVEGAEDGEDKPITYYDLHQVEWFRVTELCENCSSDLKRDFSMNLALRLEFKYNEYTTLRLLSRIRKQVCVYLSPVTVVQYQGKGHISALSSKHYDSFYALKCILTRSYELMDQLEARQEFQEANKFLSEKANEDSKLLAEALVHIYNALDKGHVVMFMAALKHFYTASRSAVGNKKQGSGKDFSHTENIDGNIDLSERIVYVKRALLMPTHVRYLPPQPSLYNRVLKDGNPDCFLRVSIRDVNLKKINFTARTGHSELHGKYVVGFFDEHIKRQVLHGIKLGNRTFEYLGASTSQLRSHSFWCYAKDERKRTAEDIRKSVGDLDEIQQVPKFMARMGLWFSQSMISVEVPQKYTNIDNPEPDIVAGKKIYLSDDDDDASETDNKKYLHGKYVKNCDLYKAGDVELHDREQSEDNQTESVSEENLQKDEPYTFSDGIGRMSCEIAEQIYKKLNIEEEEEKPSAAQIRYAGCKGMLVVDPRLEGKRIVFRESMKKYSSKHETLQVIKISKPRTLFLNRPLITILEYKGVPKEVFLCLQRKMVHDLIKSIFHDEEAHKLLNANSKLRIDYTELLKSGISFSEDPFFRSMVLAIFRLQIYLLKTKARISLPENKARNMFGVLDETDSLDYNEVFVQFTDMDSGKTKIYEGPAVVTKSPCLHPGDVRKFMAVDREKLRHVKDCIVFPAKGKRPHPDEMAGSDLDGDEYAVIWLEDLIFEEGNTPPMHYAIPKAKHLNRDRPIGVAEQLDHFRNYILNDNVGLLASAHLAWADREGGPHSERCIRIAKKHAKAIDFAKTGRTAKMSGNDMVHIYPDFMEKKDDKKTYVSQRALGHLYRMCKRLEMDLGETTNRMEYKLDSDLVYDGWEKYKKSAEKVYAQYAKKVMSWLKHYNFLSEGELLSGNFVRVIDGYEQEDDMYNLLEMVEFQALWLREKLESEFFQEFGGKPKNGIYSEDMLQKASAWYCVTYKQNNSEIFGLPWLISDVLVAVKKKRCQPSLSEGSIFIKEASYVENAIDRYVHDRMNTSSKDLSSEDEETQASYKYQILDGARNILSKWLRENQKMISAKIEDLEKHIDQEFNMLSMKLLSCDTSYLSSIIQTSEGKKIFSPGHYVLETLIRISEMGSGQEVHATYSETLAEFGRLAWITLIRLACSCNIIHLGLRDSSGHHLPETYRASKQNVIESVQVPLKGSDEEFRLAVVQEEDLFRSIMISQTKVKDLLVWWDATNNGFILKVTAEGQQHTVDRLKEFVGKNDFISIMKRLMSSASKNKLKEDKYNNCGN